LLLKTRAAEWETFNLKGVAPISAEVNAQYAASKLNPPKVTARSPSNVSSAKACGLVGYQPRHSKSDTLNDGLAMLRSWAKL